MSPTKTTTPHPFAGKSTMDLIAARDSMPDGLVSAVIDGLEDIVLLLDNDLQLIGSNLAAVQERTEIPPEILLPCYTCARTRADKCDECLMHRTLEDGNELESTFVAEDHAYAYRRWLKPLQDDDGQPQGLLIILRDETELRRSEVDLARRSADAAAENEQLQRAIEHAQSLTMETEAAHESMAHFLANMSHEIRTPMNGVLGMTELLLGTELTAEQQDFVATANSSAESLLGIINDILDFSKIEAGKLELEEIPFDLAGTLEEVGDLLALKAHDKGLDFITSVDDDLPLQLKGDPTRIRQIVINLAGNAIKFTEEGEVSIAAELEFGDATAVMVRIKVRDTGVGVPAAAQAKLFEPFSQADGSTTRTHGGTGLGLSICKLLSEMMGGECGVESAPGEGSTFWVTMVLGAIVDNAEAAGPAPSSAILAGRRVLIVDPNPAVAGDLAAVCARWNAGEARAATAADVLADREADRPLVFVAQQVLAEDPASWLARAAGCDLVALERLGHGLELPADLAAALKGTAKKPIKRQPLAHLLDELAGVKQAGVKAPARTRDWEDTDLGDLKVLVAEDNVVNQKVVVRFLRKMGIEQVTVVENGQEALDSLAAAPCDVVLMDIQMPVMDGKEAIKRIRQGQGGIPRDLHVIALTANALVGDREEYLRDGANDYLPKPLKADALAEALGQLVPTA